MGESGHNKEQASLPGYTSRYNEYADAGMIDNNQT